MSTNEDNNIPREVDHVLRVLGDDHVLCIIASLRDKELRFNELQRRLKINPTTLSDRLNRLEQEEILNKKKETVDKISVVYELTEKGRAILPIMNEFEKFAQKFHTKAKKHPSGIR